jgi:hypothetical protein
VLAVIWFWWYILGMNSFIKGMGSLNLFPRVKQHSESKPETAWEAVGCDFEAVGQAFREVGDSLRWAMNETAKTEPHIAGK